MDSFFVNKGSIVYLLENSSYDIEFMYNPETFRRSHGFKHGSADVSGRSHPFYGGGCGTEESVQFTLQLDADRGYYGRRIQRNPNILDPAWYSWKLAEEALTGDVPMSSLEDLGPLIDLFHTLTLPEDDKSAPLGNYGVPPRFFMDLGSLIKAEIAFDGVTTDILKYSPKLTVLRANIEINCHIIRQSNLTNAVLMSKHAPRIESDLDIVMLSTED